MFTGIVEQMGEVQKAGPRLAVSTPLAAELERGDSIAVNGVCLTAVVISGDRFEADVMEETLVRSSLGRLRQGDRVNLELALRVGDRLGGHFVQGHVDSTGRVETIDQREHSCVVRIGAPPELLRYVVEKGSIAVDGVSLTVVEVDAKGFTISLIPETLERTTLGSVVEGDPVNLEVDMLAKYAVKAQ
ncbi:MAG TPA: riboflavin synthase [Thermoleophilaceae bacterium]|jgi:riboflavin synthase|nr:riboflavin synthase [Thermoleophilaceae bacterium]